MEATAVTRSRKITRMRWIMIINSAEMNRRKYNARVDCRAVGVEAQGILLNQPESRKHVPPPQVDRSDGDDRGGIGVSVPQGRMNPIANTGPLHWVQLRNAFFHPAIFRKMIGR